MKSQIKTFALFGAFAAGFACPQAAALSFLIRYLIALMMFCSLLKMRSSRRPLRREHWYILAANLVIGMGSWAVLYFSGYPVLAEAAFFTGITPIKGIPMTKNRLPATCRNSPLVSEPVTKGISQGRRIAMPIFVTRKLEMTNSLLPPSMLVTALAAVAVGVMPVKNAASARTG